ncbi:MAG: DnaJ C-terminal domain-containing protein, partial [Myxococcota bacterium]|nr:DnaJ C-terminal domain-containing protein [Myxococcota bacterium]
MQPDLYDLLQVDRSATPDELKKAYRKQARKFHPDRNPGDDEAELRFKEVTYAYQVLSDSLRRAQYDRFGRVFTDGRSQGPFGVSEDVNLGEVVGKVFKDLFGGRRRERPGHRKQDLRYTVTISLEEAATGTEKVVSFQRQTADQGSQDERLKVKVPPGVDTGQKLKVRGKGEGSNSSPGDLYVMVNVADHPYFRRRGLDIFCDVPVTYAQTLLGTELEVPTLYGTSVIRLPPGTQPGAVLTLKGKGLPRLKPGGPRKGHQFIKVILDLPEELPAALQKKLLALDRALSELPSPVRTAYQAL